MNTDQITNSYDFSVDHKLDILFELCNYINIIRLLLVFTITANALPSVLILEYSARGHSKEKRVAGYVGLSWFMWGPETTIKI